MNRDRCPKHDPNVFYRLLASNFKGIKLVMGVNQVSHERL